MSWIDDPKLARQLARFSWVTLVVAFVLLTRAPLAPTHESAALGALIALFAALNAPVAVGLSHTRAQSGTPAWRAIAVGFAFRVIALVAVVALVSVN